MVAANLPRKTWRAEQIRQNELSVAASLGISSYELMERAGLSVWERASKEFSEPAAILVLCGHGNNGGDGYIVARHALQHGWQVTVIQVTDHKPLSGDAKKAQQAWHDAGGDTLSGVDSSTYPPENYSLIIDAMLGTGISGTVSPTFQHWITSVNEARESRRESVVVAVDIPSGLDANNGFVHGHAIKADLTVTFVGIKTGLLTGEAADYTGELHFSGIGIDDAFSRQIPAHTDSLSWHDIQSLVPQRALSAHKGHFGHVLLIGGNKGMPGAIRLAGEAALRCGAGLVSVLTHESSVPVVASGRPELMIHGFRDEEQSAALLDKADVIVIGPGLGQDSWARTLLIQVLNSAKPALIDADGLNLVANLIATDCVPCDVFSEREVVFTPHPGEMARLARTSSVDIATARLDVLNAMVEKFSVTILLKGFGTLIQRNSPQVGEWSNIRLNRTGNPGMASGGMGDVLSGIIGALMAQGLSGFDAASVGAWLHGQAADIAAQDGMRGLVASDLFPVLRKLIDLK